jgi:dihydroxyacetone kinase
VNRIRIFTAIPSVPTPDGVLYISPTYQGMEEKIHLALRRCDSAGTAEALEAFIRYVMENDKLKTGATLSFSHLLVELQRTIQEYQNQNNF